jgi:uncharacterized protein with HEPN domain
MRDERLYLRDIVAACEAIARFMDGHDSDSFYASTLLESAVAYQLMIIGEAAAHVSKELKSRHPEIPWGDIVGARNATVHQYFGCNWDEVWETASNGVPVLRIQIAAILRDEFPG